MNPILLIPLAVIGAYLMNRIAMKSSGMDDWGPSKPTPPTPPPTSQKPPGERVRIGDRFEADLSGYLGNQLHPELNLPGQIFVALFVNPTGLPSPAGLDIAGRHEATGIQVTIGSGFVTRVF